VMIRKMILIVSKIGIMIVEGQMKKKVVVTHINFMKMI